MAIRIRSAVPPLNIDNRNGLGATPSNAEVDYFGLRVLMTPRTFLKLAAPLTHEDKESYNTIRAAIQKGEGIGAPFLEIQLDKKSILGDPPRPGVRGHEGRHRMTVISDVYGPQHEVEVHLFLVPGGRHRDFTPELIADLNAGMFPEKLSSIIYKGPYFKVM